MHTITELKAMGDERLNELIAEMQGLYPSTIGTEYCWRSKTDKNYLRSICPQYTTDIRAAYELEESVSENKKRDYVIAIMQLSSDDILKTANSSWVFSLIHATPRQRCIAFILAMEGTK